MDEILPEVLEADLLAFGTPVHMGYATGLMMCFLERIVWTCGKPARNYLTVRGCPAPRDTKRRRAAILVTSGIVTPFYRRFCDQATPLIRGTIKDSLGARTVVGNILASHYLHQAYRVGHRIRVGEIRGRIEEIHPTHVILEADEGRILVPAKEFAETISVLLHEGSEK